MLPRIACAIFSTIGEPDTSSTVEPSGSAMTAFWSSSEPSTRIVSTGAPGAQRTTLAVWYGSATSSAPAARPGSCSSSTSVQPATGTPIAVRISCATSSSVSRRGSTTTTRSGGAARSQRSTAERISPPEWPLRNAVRRASRISSSSPRASSSEAGAPART